MNIVCVTVYVVTPTFATHLCEYSKRAGKSVLSNFSLRSSWQEFQIVSESDDHSVGNANASNYLTR